MACYAVDNMGQTAFRQKTARNMRSWENSIPSHSPPLWEKKTLLNFSGGTLVPLANTGVRRKHSLRTRSLFE
jgi:hypothetical protein